MANSIPTDEVLDDLPVGDEEEIEEETDSGIPSFVQTAELPDEEDEPEALEDTQTTQDEAEADEAPESPPEPSKPAAPEMPSEVPKVQPAAQVEPEPPVKTPSAPIPPVPVHPAKPSVKVDASAPHPPPGNPDAPIVANVATIAPVGVLVKPVAPGDPLATAPPEHGDLVTQTTKPEPRLLKPGEQISQEVAVAWDQMMAEISQSARMAIWEMGVNNMQKLLTTPKQDLIKPRGHLVAGQVAEIEGWLTSKLGLKLPQTRQQAVRAYTPPKPVMVAGANIATRKVTPELAAQRRAWLKDMRGDSTRK